MANHTLYILRSRITVGQPNTVPLAQTQLQTAAAKKKTVPRLVRCRVVMERAGDARYSTTLQWLSMLLTPCGRTDLACAYTQCCFVIRE